jgi:transposase-like protein
MPRPPAAARACFARASAETGVTPERVVTDKAAGYPPVLRTLLPATEHRASNYLNNGVERDHGHLKQRLRPMRGFCAASSSAPQRTASPAATPLTRTRGTAAHRSPTGYRARCAW